MKRARISFGWRELRILTWAADQMTDDLHEDQVPQDHGFDSRDVRAFDSAIAKLRKAARDVKPKP